MHVASPPKTALSQQGEHVGSSGEPQDGNIWHMVAPGDTKDGAQASEVKRVETTLLAAVRGP